VVDDQDRLEGVVRMRDLAASSSSPAVQNNPVRALMTDRIARVREEAPMAAVMQHFYDGPIDLAVVVRDEQPVGLITQEDLADLIPPGEPDTAEPIPPTAGLDPDVTVSRESLLRDMRMSSVHGLNLGDNAQCR
jgi:Mg/Co/Ni transporter MgtE